MDHDNELKHYGVVGMKWGIRRATGASSKGNSDKAKERYSKTYTKASAKANKIRKKAVDKNLKSATLQKKALNREVKATSERQYRKALKTKFKANRLQLKSAKLQKKAQKWEKQMEKSFSEVSVKNVNQEALDAGKKYAYMLMQD